MLASLFIDWPRGDGSRAALRGFREGVGNVLGSIAMIIGLGNMLGKMLAESGGAERIATTLIAWLGEKRVHWAMMLIACLVGVPVFFQVGFVLLIPLVFLLAKQTKTPLLHIGVPLLASLSVMHGLVPPHPGPMAAIEVLKANVGKTLLYSLIIGFPTPSWPVRCCRAGEPHAHRHPGDLAAQFTDKLDERSHRFYDYGTTVLLPVMLMPSRRS
jgi:GntP family gluconate:H+ symporter